MPSRSQPRSTHSCITRQISSSPARTSASVRQDSSLAEHHLADRQAGVGGDREQLGAGAERVRGPGGVRHDPVRARPPPRRPRTRRPPSSTCALAARAPAASYAAKVMPFGWYGSDRRRCRIRSRSGSKAISCAPSRLSRPLGADPRRPAASTVSVSTVSGASPSSPSRTAWSLPWPWPVAPSEPNSSARTACRVGEQPVGLEPGRRTCGRPASARPCASWTARCRREEVENTDHGCAFLAVVPVVRGPARSCRPWSGAAGRVARGVGSRLASLPAQLRAPDPAGRGAGRAADSTIRHGASARTRRGKHLRVRRTPILLGTEGAVGAPSYCGVQRGGSPQSGRTTMSRKLVRPRQGRMLAGVCPAWRSGSACRPA